jgi:hypothetical protein
MLASSTDDYGKSQQYIFIKLLRGHVNGVLLSEMSIIFSNCSLWLYAYYSSIAFWKVRIYELVVAH